MAYKFVIDNIVIVLDSYDGEMVTGVAKCDPRDKFNYDIGTVIAEARCNLKIAEKRAKRASNKLIEAKKEVAAAQKIVKNMEEYVQDADRKLEAAKAQLDCVLREYNG